MMTTVFRDDTGTATQRRTTRRGPSLTAPTVETDVWIWCIAGLAACFTVLFQDAAPVDIGAVDAIYRALVVAATVRLAARAKRHTWVIVCAAGAASTGSLVGQVFLVAALVTAVTAQLAPRRNRMLGALLAAIAILGLFDQVVDGLGPLERLSLGYIHDFTGSATLIGLCAAVPLWHSAWKRSRRSTRHTTRQAFRVVVLFVTVATIGSAALGALAARDARNGVAETRAAVAAINDADAAGAERNLLMASDSWNAAHRWIGGFWMAPVRLVPVLGQHTHAAQTGLGHAHSLARDSVPALRAVTGSDFTSEGGLNETAIDRLTPPIRTLATSLDRASTALGDLDSPWLFPPLRSTLATRVTELEEINERVTAGSDVLGLVNGLLTRAEPGRVLLVFTTPAEARGLGGFAGHWVEVTLNAGDLELSAQYRSKDLNDLLTAASAELRASEDYVARYGRFNIEEHIQDVTISPDGPTVAAVAADLYSQATGTAVDAVVFVDPFVVDTLLEFTGPVQVNDDLQLRAGTAANTLLVDQYVMFADDEQNRESVLASLAPEMLGRLTTEPPDPMALGRAIAPLVEEGRLMVWLRDDEGDSSRRLGVAAEFPRTQSDLLGIVHQNAGQNKIDTQLQREVRIETQLANGTATHTMSVTLTNNAPPSGLPDAIIASNDQGLEFGSNRLTLSTYAQLPLVSAHNNGEQIGMEFNREFGVNVYSTVLSIPPLSEITLDFVFSGQVDVDSYELLIPNQPTANPDILDGRIVDKNGVKLAVWDQVQTGPLRISPAD